MDKTENSEFDFEASSMDNIILFPDFEKLKSEV